MDRTKKKSAFIRNFEAGNYLENFLVSAVSAILVIRLFLKLTGYPQISNSTLHIAHLLWGGLLMLVSIIILLSFLSRGAEHLASILGGIGFGTFIDEVGKFVTQDNNYFFQPAVAIMYVTFILIIIAIRSIEAGRNYSTTEYLMNALREMEEVVLHDMDEEGRKRALSYLDKSDKDNPLVAALRNILPQTHLIPTSKPGFYARMKLSFQNFYYKIVKLRAFSIGIIVFFLVQMIISLAYAVVLVFFLGLGWDKILDVKVFDHIANRVDNLSFVDWAELLSSLLSGVFVFIGVFNIHRSRLFAFQMFERSILVTIFLTQVFIFYKEQFAALTGLFFNILILIAVRYMIEREQTMRMKQA
ncbi:MAG TPA: hypothetical protein VNN20_02335 [Thermodesulfobacteriota bacterium]|nr:hypothetical protein [Thermodesulfobacteriota bacterium]